MLKATKWRHSPLVLQVGRVAVGNIQQLLFSNTTTMANFTICVCNLLISSLIRTLSRSNRNLT